MQKITDPWPFDIDCEKYGKMNEVLRFVRSSFVEKPPGLIFNTCIKEPGTHELRFSKLFANSWSKDAGHPFYAEVYQEAAKLNLEFANQMDACIIR